MPGGVLGGKRTSKASKSAKRKGGKGASAYQIRFPKALARPKQLLARRPRHDKIPRKINTADTVEAADERLALRTGLLGRHDARHDGADEPRPEALLVQARADEVRHRAGADLALFAQAVHVHFVAHQVRDGGDVGGEAGQAEVEVRAVGEDLGEVVRDGEGLEAEAEVAGDGDAVFARHGEAGSAIFWERGTGLVRGDSMVVRSL